MAEQLICNQQVGGSTPFASSKKIKGDRLSLFSLFLFYVGATYADHGLSLTSVPHPSLMSICFFFSQLS